MEVSFLVLVGIACTITVEQALSRTIPESYGGTSPVATKSTISILQFEHSHLSKKLFQWIPVVICWPIRVIKQNRQFEYLHLPKQGFEWVPVVLCWLHRVA